jgi:hypothetical protein
MKERKSLAEQQAMMTKGGGQQSKQQNNNGNSTISFSFGSSSPVSSQKKPSASERIGYRRAR